MSNRASFLIVVILLLLAASLRMWDLTTLPPGFSDAEYVDIQLIEMVRTGSIRVFHQLGDEGREGLYHTLQALTTTFTGDGPVGFRMLPIWLNLLALALIYAVGRRLFGPLAGISAMAILVVSFWPVLLSRQVGREAVVPFFINMILLSLILILPLYRKRHRRGAYTTAAAAFGFFLGITLYIHPLGLLAVLFAFSFIAYMIRFQGNMSRRRISYISFGVLLMLIVTMPYTVSSIRIPKLGGVERLTGERMNLKPESVIDSLVSLFVNGDANPLHNLPGRPLFDPLSGLLIVIGILIALQYWRIPRYLFLLFGLVIFMPVFLMSQNAPDFSNVTGALPLLALLFGIGLSAASSYLMPQGRAARLGLPLLAGVVVINLFWTGSTLFDRWPGLDSVQSAYNGRIGQLAHYADLTAKQIPTIVCGWQPGSAKSSMTNDARRIEISMHRETHNLRYVDCANAFILTNGGEAQQVLIPGQALLDSLPSEIRQWFELAELLEQPDLPENGVIQMMVEQPLADRAGLLTATATARLGPEAGGSRDQVMTPPISLSNNLTFLGYVAEPVEYFSPGDTFTLVTYWRIQDGVVPSDLRLFTHVLSDPGASPPANTDILSLNPRYLRNRDVFIQVTRIPLPASLPDGTYTISIGAYRNLSDIRLDVLENGEIRGTRLFLFDITVKTES